MFFQDLVTMRFMTYQLLPVPIMMLATLDDADRRMIEEIYQDYKKLLYHVARRYFPNEPDEINEAISETLERICRYSANLHGVECNKRRNYVVSIIRNVCNSRIKAIRKEREMLSTLHDEAMVAGPDKMNGYPQEMIFDYADTRKLLDSFYGLKKRDRDLIWMRYVDQMEYAEIAEALGMKEAAARVALMRAKAKLELAVREGGTGNEEI